ncbi:hypothetical protein SNR37_002257 [Agarivorans aestuarii]|uniref:AP2 domain-containing protein n=1 Tax=Agarivorans aestuarii TaxID=1563703 RepID=A0ABU7G092_9ALTE|nr:hypothetical protein [Agarivorans aestuarii]MEE1672847.1 hypothetical protein [Agarivorans aestuarii]
MKGVSFHKRDELWMAHIFIEGKRRHLGCFKKQDEAIAARKAAENECTKQAA